MEFLQKPLAVLAVQMKFLQKPFAVLLVQTEFLQKPLAVLLVQTKFLQKPFAVLAVQTEFLQKPQQVFTVQTKRRSNSFKNDKKISPKGDVFDRRGRFFIQVSAAQQTLCIFRGQRGKR